MIEPPRLQLLRGWGDDEAHPRAGRADAGTRSRGMIAETLGEAGAEAPGPAIGFFRHGSERADPPPASAEMHPALRRAYAGQAQPRPGLAVALADERRAGEHCRESARSAPRPSMRTTVRASPQVARCGWPEPAARRPSRGTSHTRQTRPCRSSLLRRASWPGSSPRPPARHAEHFVIGSTAHASSGASSRAGASWSLAAPWSG